MHELEHEPAIAGAPTMRGFLPGIHMRPDEGAGGDLGGVGGDEGAADLGGGAAAGAAVDALGGDAPVVTPPIAVPPSAWHEDPAALDFIDQRAQQLLEQQLAPLIPLLEQVLGGGDGAAAPAPGTLNPWDENFPDTLEGRLTKLEQSITQKLDQFAAPFAERQQQELVHEGNQRLDDMLADDIARNGDFPRAIDPATQQPVAESKAEKLVKPLAQMFFPDIASRFGQTPRAAELAMTRAAGIVREIVAEASSAALASETNRLETLAGTRTELGVPVIGVRGREDTRSRSIEEGLGSVTERYAPMLRGN